MFKSKYDRKATDHDGSEKLKFLRIHGNLCDGIFQNVTDGVVE
jgi:hypothetical protein